MEFITGIGVQADKDLDEAEDRILQVQGSVSCLGVQTVCSPDVNTSIMSKSRENQGSWDFLSGGV